MMDILLKLDGQQARLPIYHFQQKIQWKVVGNNKLSVGKPVTAEWNNKSGLSLEKNRIR